MIKSIFYHVFVASANLMCQKQKTSCPEGKTDLPRRSSRPPSRPSILLPLAIAIIIATLITLLILVLPLYTEHRVYVTIGQDTIIDVSAQTVKVPYVSTFFPPSYPFGVYTIEIEVQNFTTFQNVTVPQFLYNVPIGQYTFVLQNVTTGYFYDITAILIKNNLTIATFPISATF
jgi:hypothetical protein